MWGPSCPGPVSGDVRRTHGPAELEISADLPVDAIESIGRTLVLAKVKAVLFCADTAKFYELKEG